MIISATSYGEIRRQQDNSTDRKIADLWKRMKLRRNIDSKDITHDLIGSYTEILKKMNLVT